MPADPALGEALRLFRQERQLTLEELGAVTELHRVYLAGVEAGRRDPTFTTLRTLAQAMGLQVSDIVLRAEAIAADGHGPPPAA